MTPLPAGGESDIRAQFFAQLASSLTEKDNKASPATSGSTKMSLYDPSHEHEKYAMQ